MARKVKSLRHNIPLGKDIPGHREHRSKKGRRIRNWDYWRGKMHREELEKLRFKEQDENINYWR